MYTNTSKTFDEYTSGSWLSYKKAVKGKHAQYKLHVYIPVKNFDAYQRRIYNILQRAVEDGVIPEFKVLNRGNAASLIEQLGGDASVTIQENPNARIYNNPFTIYLYDDFIPEQILDLCKQIEIALSGLPFCNREHLSIADLAFMPHLTFRQETLNDQYVAIAGADPATLEQLKSEGERSIPYKKLKALLLSKAQTSTSEQSSIELENFIQGFYNNNFHHYESQLNTTNINKQFQTACALLNCSEDALKRCATKEEWLKTIKIHCHRAALKFHSDRVRQPKLSTTKERADEIFKLIMHAKGILEAIAENPKVLNKASLTEQIPYLPQYQYELKDGFCDDPYYYISLARSNKTCLLIQNWDYIYVRETIAPQASSGCTALEIYKPQLEVYTGADKKTLHLPGYQAFYHLFMSGALPRRFDQGHFDMIFSGSHLDRWLLEKALTTPEFINFMDSYTLQSLSIRATEEGVVPIGSNPTEVFIYFYTQFPELLYNRRVEKFCEMKGFDRDKFTQTVLAQPHQLALLGCDLDDFFKMDSRLKQWILNDRTLINHCSSYYLSKKIVPEILSTDSETHPFLRTVLEQLLLGYDEFLKYLSKGTLLVLRDIIHHNKNYPKWVMDNIDLALDFMQGSKEQLGSLQSQEINYTYIDPKQYIKTQFVTQNDPNILKYLNKDSLIWLAAEPEVHWAQYLSFIDALINLNALEAAQRYIKCLSLVLVPDGGMLSYETLKTYSSALAEQYQIWRSQHIENLLEAYEHSILGTKPQNETLLVEQLAFLGAEDKLHALKKSLKKRFLKQFDACFNRLKQGEKTEQLKQEMQELINKGTQLKYHDLFNLHDILGNTLYILMGKIIGIKDNNDYWHRGDEAYETFGIQFDEDALKAFEELYYLYACFDATKHFYKHLSAHTTKIKGEAFDKNKINQHIISFLDNELAVFVEGSRENAGYKTHRFYDAQNIRAYKELSSLYYRLDEELYLQAMLPDIYAKLADQEKSYDPKPYKKYRAAKLEQSWWSREDIPMDDPTRPLIKYIEIRKTEKDISPTLETLAFHYLLHQLIDTKYGNLKKKDFWEFDFENSRAITLCNEIKQAFDPLRRGYSEESLQTLTKKMLDSLAKFLDSDSYTALIEDLANIPILRDYLHITKAEMNPEERQTLIDNMHSGELIQRVENPKEYKRLLLEEGKRSVEENEHPKDAIIQKLEAEISRLKAEDKKLFHWAHSAFKIAAYNQIIKALNDMPLDESLASVLEKVGKTALDHPKFRWYGKEYYEDAHGMVKHMDEHTEEITVAMILTWRRNKYSFFSATSANVWNTILQEVGCTAEANNSDDDLGISF